MNATDPQHECPNYNTLADDLPALIAAANRANNQPSSTLLIRPDGTAGYIGFTFASVAEAVAKLKEISGKSTL